MAVVRVRANNQSRKPQPRAAVPHFSFATIHLCHNSTDGFSRTRDGTLHSEAPSFRLQRAQRGFFHALRVRSLHCAWSRHHAAWAHPSFALDALGGHHCTAWVFIFLAVHSLDDRHIAQRSDALEAE